MAIDIPPAARAIGFWFAVLATVYAVLISLSYFVQLTWVAPRLARGQTQGIESFLFVPGLDVVAGHPLSARRHAGVAARRARVKPC